jgi:hypothetical protein
MNAFLCSFLYGFCVGDEHENESDKLKKETEYAPTFAVTHQNTTGLCDKPLDYCSFALGFLCVLSNWLPLKVCLCLKVLIPTTHLIVPLQKQ